MNGLKQMWKARKNKCVIPGKINVSTPEEAPMPLHC